MKRTFKFKTSNPLTLLRNHADFVRWKRQYGIWTTANDAPIYPILANFYRDSDEEDKPQYFDFEQIEEDASTLKSAYCALLREMSK